jgi:hypothetical protein
VQRISVIDSHGALGSGRDALDGYKRALVDPEVEPDAAREAGAAVVGTGRSDHPNQVNNVLAFPGLFCGALDAALPQVEDDALLRAARALADLVEERRLHAAAPARPPGRPGRGGGAEAPPSTSAASSRTSSSTQRSRANQVYSQLRAVSIDYTFALPGYKNHDLYFGPWAGTAVSLRVASPSWSRASSTAASRSGITRSARPRRPLAAG